MKRPSAPGEPATTPALWVSTQTVGESDALVRFFTPDDGALTVKARGLLKAGAKLAAALQPADELAITLAGRRGTKATTGVLTGVRTAAAHPHWRASLDRLALVWFMAESLYAGSGPPPLNEAAYQLTVNLLRSGPDDSALFSAASVFALRLLGLHGLLPELSRCAVDHSELDPAAPAFLLPSGEGLIGLAAYNRKYARGAVGLTRLSPQRLTRWRTLRHGALLDYAQAQADRADAALLTGLLARQLADLANQQISSLKFLRQQWKLPGWHEVADSLG